MNLFHETAKVQLALSRLPQAPLLRRVFAELGDPQLPLNVGARTLNIHDENGVLVGSSVPEFSAALPSGFRVASYRDNCRTVVEYRTQVADSGGRTVSEFAGNRGALAFWYLEGRHVAKDPDAGYKQRPKRAGEG